VRLRPVSARASRALSIPNLPTIGAVPESADGCPASPYLRVQAAAKYVVLSVSMLNKLRCSGGGPTYYRLGRAVLYRRADLDAWVERSARCSTSQVMS
jgi:hypothetical protein